MILTLKPEVGADGQDSATESAGPCLVIDVAVSERQETGALVAGELFKTICLAVLQGPAGPVFEHVLVSVEEI